MDVKVECDRINTLCYGCLSTGRAMSIPSREFSELFYKLRNDDKHQYEQELLLCWECIAFLEKLKTFQKRIKTAQCLLMQYLQTYYNKDISFKPQSLSRLNSIHINKYTYEFNEEETHINIELNNVNDKQNDCNGEDKVFNEELKEIKEECRNAIKEEFNSNNDNDSDYFENEYKLENEDNIDKPSNEEKKTSAHYKYRERKRYEIYATITKNADTLPSVISEYVCVSRTEYDDVLEREEKVYRRCKKPFKCGICNVGYVRELDLLRHESFYHNNKSSFPYKCAACTTMINSPEHLDQHWSSIHTVMIRCVLCSQLCRSTGEVRKHVNRKHLKKYNCKECRQEFGTLSDFAKHYKTAHQSVVCDHCKMSFPKKKTLVSHIRMFHLPAFCDICNRTYSNHKTFKYHLQVTHPELIAGETRKELSYCVECDKQYPSVFKYRRHLQLSPRHTPQKKLRVPCPDCGKIFTRTNFMRNHYRFVHLKVTKNYCDQCDKYYTTGYGLRKHIDRVHKKITPPKDKICDICGRGFGTNKILTNHRRTHTGERPYKCKFCPAAFAQQTAMKTHQKTQHKNINLDLTS